jgi:hypothetical protein
LWSVKFISRKRIICNITLDFHGNTIVSHRFHFCTLLLRNLKITMNNVQNENFTSMLVLARNQISHKNHNSCLKDSENKQ